MYSRAIRCNQLFKSSYGVRSHTTLIQTPPPQPSVTTCPEPTCSCAETPPGLDIHHDLRLAGTVPPYKEHVVIFTDTKKWPKRIGDHKNSLAGRLKAVLGRDGSFHDPLNPILVTNSCSSARDPASSQSRPRIMLFPSFLHISGIPHSDKVRFHEFIRDYLRGSRLGLRRFLENFNLQRTKDTAVAPSEKNTDLSTIVSAPNYPPSIQSRSSIFEKGQGAKVTFIKHIIILICAHGSRDSRCGILGPLIRDQFDTYLKTITPYSTYEKTILANIQIRLCSHVGGHNFAGNVLIYTPPTVGNEGIVVEGVAGTGVWYGRVEPKHVEGIVRETLLGGRVIEELYRGGVAGWVEGDDGTKQQ